MRIPIVYFLATLIIFQSCSQSEKDDRISGSPFNRDGLANHIRMLASDSFQGRKPFTVGETRTVDYLQNQFRALGLQPGNGDSYMQEVPMVSITVDPDSVMKVKSAKGSFNLRRFHDFVVITQNADSIV
jgi:hypothetical protein